MSAHVRRFSAHAPRYLPVRGRRGEFAKIEQRRREYLGDARSRPLPRPTGVEAGPRTSALARAGATAALASLFVFVAFSTALTVGGGPIEAPVAQGRSFPTRGEVAMRERTSPRVVAAIATHHVVARLPAKSHERRIARAPIVPLHSFMPAPVLRALPLRATNGGLSIEAQPWELTADGTWRTEVVAYFGDEGGEKQPRLHAQVEFSADGGQTVDADPWVHQTPATIVSTRGGSVDVVANALDPAAGSASLTLPGPPTDAGSFAVAARAIGPHLVAVGWTPLADAGVHGYRVYRQSADGEKTMVALVSSAGNSWRDSDVSPDSTYEYTVQADTQQTQPIVATAHVDTPDEMAQTSIDAIAGKGMFLFFSPDTTDANSYAQFDPDDVIARAAKAGVSDIELRLSRGTFVEAANPAVRNWLDRLIDGASAANIKLIAWSVPRRNSTDDVAESVEMARYRTAAGNGFAGLSLDLEPGDNYMGHGAAARERIADYMEMTRAAVGPNYLLIATVLSPQITHFSNDDYPYARIARFASVMQPMEYWHHFRSTHDYAQADVTDDCTQVVARTKMLAGRNVPVNVAGQSTDLGRTGQPSGSELQWCLGAAQAAGAIGEMFFSYQGTSADQWAAIESYRW